MSTRRTKGSTSASAKVRQSRTSWISSLRVCAKMRLICFSLFLGGYFALLASPFDNADEDILHREALLPGLEYSNSVCQKLFRDRSLSTCRVVIGNDVEAIAKQGDAPSFHVSLEQIGRWLGLVDHELQQMTALFALDAGRRPLHNEFAGNHQAEAITLL